jgi:hypothetical protein
MTPEEQVEFARRRCRVLLDSRLAAHNVRRSLRVDGLDHAIIDEAVAEYEGMLAAAQRRDRLWWRLGALVVLLCMLGYLVPQFIRPNFQFHRHHSLFVAIAVVALLQLLRPNLRQLS